jgi:hypothetical protein
MIAPTAAGRDRHTRPPAVDSGGIDSRTNRCWAIRARASIGPAGGRLPLAPADSLASEGRCRARLAWRPRRGVDDENDGRKTGQYDSRLCHARPAGQRANPNAFSSSVKKKERIPRGLSTSPARRGDAAYSSPASIRMAHLLSAFRDRSGSISSPQGPPADRPQAMPQRTERWTTVVHGRPSWILMDSQEPTHGNGPALEPRSTADARAEADRHRPRARTQSRERTLRGGGVGGRQGRNPGCI